MGRRTRKSKRKLNSLFMMLLLTAVLTIVSTYAWFSANREVSITGITAKVAAAEGLQISIDGIKWGSSVTVNDETLAAATKAVNNYVWPEELEPVSSDGTFTSGDLNFYYGDISADGNTLSGIEKASDSLGKYIVFDIYLKNSSSNSGGDKLQLSTGSSVAINTEEGGKDNTGLENSVRTGLLLYSDTAMFTAALGNNTDQLTDASGNRTIAGIQPGTPLASFWEPNYNQHIGFVVDNDTRISNAEQRFQTLAMTADSVGKNIKGVGGSTVAAGVSVNAKGETIASDSGTYMAIPSTIETAGSVSDNEIEMKAVDGTTQLMLQPNSIMKARVYIWLEGQDPDCNDTASTGRAFDVIINLSKPGKGSSSSSSTGGSGGTGGEGSGSEGTGGEGTGG